MSANTNLIIPTGAPEAVYMGLIASPRLGRRATMKPQRRHLLRMIDLPESLNRF